MSSREARNPVVVSRHPAKLLRRDRATAFPSSMRSVSVAVSATTAARHGSNDARQAFAVCPGSSRSVAGSRSSARRRGRASEERADQRPRSPRANDDVAAPDAPSRSPAAFARASASTSDRAQMLVRSVLGDQLKMRFCGARRAPRRSFRQVRVRQLAHVPHLRSEAR
jgi:hypothetical protein